MPDHTDTSTNTNHRSLDSRARAMERLVLLLLVSLSLAFLYRSPYSASGLEVVPDSVEYAIGARRLVTLGHYDIAFNGASYPPRYAPWFSALALAPVYLLTHGDDGAGILAVLAFGLTGVIAAYALGKRLGGPWGGAGAALCLMAFKEYHVMARLIMTDLPCAVLGMLACLVYLRLLDAPRPLSYLTAGVICGVAFGFRYDMAALCLPFALLALRNRDGRWVNLVCLLAPSLLVEAATLLYNAHAFGDWRRNGYQFWCADPYDYPWLVWSAAYVKRNLINLFAKQALLIMVLGAVGTAVLWRRQAPYVRPILLFIALAAGPSALIHLFYFSAGLRFFLLGICLLAVLGGAGIAALIPASARQRQALLPVLLSVCLLAVPLIKRKLQIPTWWSPPTRRIAADRIARLTPDNAVIVSAIDPAYLDWRVVRGTHRTVVPVSRGVGYANLVIVRKAIRNPNPPPVLYQPRSPGMVRGGAIDAVPFTADEAPERLLAWAKQGRPIYLEMTDVRHSYPDPKTLQLFHTVRVSNSVQLLQLVPRN